MFKKALPLFLLCETPLHAGSGNELGVIDSPVQRERHTNFPKIEGSSLKGCVRESFESLQGLEDNKSFKKLSETFSDLKDKENYENAVSLIFGPAPDVSGKQDKDSYAGAMGFSDARVLLFPVKSMRGVFAYATCPKCLSRLKIDFEQCGITDVPDIPDAGTVTESNSLMIDNKIILEEYTFDVKKDNKCSGFAKYLSDKIFPKDKGDTFDYWINKIKNDLVVLSDDDFADFVTLSTEVITRTRINHETGTVAEGALFNEEYVPAETVFYSLSLFAKIFKEEKGIFKPNGKSETELMQTYFKNGLPGIIQLGGNATLGKGLMRTNILEVN